MIYNITLNPYKFKFGLKEVEYVGHVINDTGPRLTLERRETVFNMAYPTMAKQLKSFIECAGTPRMLIRDLSTELRRLHPMIRNYDCKRKLLWNQEAIDAWDQIR